jgi:hypothetical protein
MVPSHGLPWLRTGVRPELSQVAESAQGLAPTDILENKPPEEKFSFLFAQGGSLGLQVPYLLGNETIELTNILPDLHALIQLPGERPVIQVDGRKGVLLDTTPVVHSVIIEPSFQRVSLVWQGHAMAIRPYMSEELKTMPLRVQWI